MESRRWLNIFFNFFKRLILWLTFLMELIKYPYRWFLTFDYFLLLLWLFLTPSHLIFGITIDTDRFDDALLWLLLRLFNFMIKQWRLIHRHMDQCFINHCHLRLFLYILAFDFLSPETLMCRFCDIREILLKFCCYQILNVEEAAI